MKIDILTLFPKMFSGPFDESILRRAQDKLLVKINLHNLRQWAIDKHGSVDDRPYGGGAGMVIRVDVVDKALRALKIKDQSIRPFDCAQGRQAQDKRSKIKNTNRNSTPKCAYLESEASSLASSRGATSGQEPLKERVILLTPQGNVFTQKKARELSELDRIILVCGHYEGFDERIREHLVDEELSIGEYVLTGGELPAMVVTDAVTRLLPGVLLKEEATRYESFGEFNIEKIKDQSIRPFDCAQGRQAQDKRLKIKTKIKNLEFKVKHNDNAQCIMRNAQNKLLEYPQYTRPAEFRGWKVPEILISGNHEEIKKWRLKKMTEKTKKEINL